MDAIKNEIKITTICENTASRGGLLGEHGLAVLLELQGQRFLFDTGAGETLLNNAKLLGLDLSSIDAVILSHGHYDHTGGLEAILKMKRGDTLPVYAHPAVFDQKYSQRRGQKPRYIGPPWERSEMEALGARFQLERGAQHLGEGILATGEIPRRAKAELPGPSFLVKGEQGFTEDQLLDDQALVMESDAGLIVLLGCAHAGVINTLEQVLALTGRSEIYALLGGMHLLHTPANLLEGIISRLKRYRLQLLAPCHCTGMQAGCALQAAFGEKWVEHQVGSVFTFPL